MKRFSKVFEGKDSLNVQENVINYIDTKQLEDYLSIASKFINEDARFVISWLIDNNDKYIQMFGDSDNALAAFFDKGMPSDNSLKPLYSALKRLNDNGLLLQVPVFQTKEQFDAIISKKISIDSIVLDLTSEEGRNKVVQQYQPLIHKIVKQWIGKSNLSIDDLYSAANYGFTYAMNFYGKRRKTTKASDEALAGYTFGQYAAYMMRMWILEEIKNNSRTVRIPTSAQKSEKKSTGKNLKNNTISGDMPIVKDEEGSKSFFDTMGKIDNSATEIDRKDLEKIWKEFYGILDANLSKKWMDSWYSFYGLNGHMKLKNKEIASKYNVTPSNVTYYCFKVNSYIKSNAKLMSLLTDAYQLMGN